MPFKTVLSHAEIVTRSQVDHYWGNRSNLFISPSIRDNMRRSAYALSNQRDDKEKAGPFFGYDDPKKIAELTGTKEGYPLLPLIRRSPV